MDNGRYIDSLGAVGEISLTHAKIFCITHFYLEQTRKRRRWRELETNRNREVTLTMYAIEIHLHRVERILSN